MVYINYLSPETMGASHTAFPAVALAVMFSAHTVLPDMSVHRIKAGSNAYVLETDSALYLIDAGYPGHEKKILSVVDRLAPKPLRLIFITHGHFDHYGSAAAVRDSTGAPIGVHEADADAMANGRTPLRHTRHGGAIGKSILLPLAERFMKPRKTVPDTVFHDGDSLRGFGLDAVVIHTPGHTEGSCCLLVRDSLLFSGDLVTSQFFFQKQRYYASDWDDIDRSVTRAQALSPRLVLPGHGRRYLTKRDLDKL